MREKLTVIKVGGKIVEEEATLNQLLNDFGGFECFEKSMILMILYFF